MEQGKNEEISDPMMPKQTIENFEVEHPDRMPVPGPEASRIPTSAYCIFCKKNITTETTYHTGRSTHFMGGLLCLLGFYCCCCCLPYHMNDCKDVRHMCPNCGSLIMIKKFAIL